MKNKQFDCVEMKHRGAEKVYQAIAGFSKEQQLDYWRRGSEALRQALQKAQEKTVPARCK
jgi:hypothetical protein